MVFFPWKHFHDAEVEEMYYDKAMGENFVEM